MTDSCCLGLDVHIEVHGIFRTGYHCLLAGVSPNKEAARRVRDILLCGKADSVFNHLLGGKGVFVAVSGNRNPFIGSEMNIRQKIVGIGQGQAVIILRLIVFQGIGLCAARLIGSEARYCHMGSHLFQNPIIAAFGRSALNQCKIGVGRNAIAVCLQVRRAGS